MASSSEDDADPVLQQMLSDYAMLVEKRRNAHDIWLHGKRMLDAVNEEIAMLALRIEQHSKSVKGRR